MKKDRENELHEMIERADEMVPKKKGILDARNVWEKKPSKKIVGEGGEVMPNKLYDRFRNLVKRK